MAYGPTELGLAQQDQRPYGEGAAEIAAARERAAAAQRTGTTAPRGGRGATPDAQDRNAGYMATPPEVPKPEPGPAPSPRPEPPKPDRFTHGQQERADMAQPYSFDWPDKPPKPGVDLLEPYRVQAEANQATWRYAEDVIGGAAGAFVEGVKSLGQAFAPPVHGDINAAIAAEHGQPAPPTPEQIEAGKKASAEQGQKLVEGTLGVLAPLALPYTTVEGEVVSHQIESDPVLGGEYRDAMAQLPPEDQQRPTVRSAVAHAVIDSAVRRLLDVRDDPNASEAQKNAADAAAFAYIFERVVSFGGVQAAREAGRLAAKFKVGATAGEAVAKADAAVKQTAKRAGQQAARQAMDTSEAGSGRLDLGLTGPENDPINRLTVTQLQVLKAVTTDEHELGLIDAAIARKATQYRTMGNVVVGETGAVVSRHANMQEAQLAADRYNSGAPTPRDVAVLKALTPEQAKQMTAAGATAEDLAAGPQGKAATPPVEQGEISFGEPPPARTPEQVAAGAKKKAKPAGIRIGNRIVRQDPESGRILEFDYKTGEPITAEVLATEGRAGERPQARAGEVVDKTAEKPATTAPREMPAIEDVVERQPDRPASANLGINLDQLHPDLPDSIRNKIEDMAQARWQDIDTQRRGTVSWEVTFARARNMGIDVPALSDLPAGVSTNAEGAAAILDAVVKTTKERMAIEDKIREAGPLASTELKAEWLTKVWEQSVLQTTFAGFRAELGRGLNILKALYKGANSGRVRDTYADAVRAMGGGKNVDQLLDRLLAIRTDPRLSPIEKERVQARFVSNLKQPRFWDYPKALWINSILSWPGTHIANISGQAALIEADVISKIPAAAYDALFSGFGKFRPRERTFTGAVTSAVVTHLSTWDAAREALLYLKTGISAEDIGVFKESGRGAQTEVFRGTAGAILQAPTRALGAEDVFYYRLGYRRELYRAAADYVATQKGGPRPFSNGFWLQVHDMASNPNAEMLKSAEEAGKRAGLRQDPGPLAEGLLAVRDWEVPYTGVRMPRVHDPYTGKTTMRSPITKEHGLQPFFYVAPFVRIGFNLASVGAEYSPLGFFRVAVKKGGARSDAAGRATVGSVVMGLFWQKAASGELTGAAPTDPKERQDFYDQGKQPYAIHVGTQWIRYDRLEPIATPLKWISGLEDARRTIAQNPLDIANYVEAAQKATGAIATSFLNQSFLQGMGDLVDALHSDQKAAAMAANIAKGFIPFSGLLRGITQMEDPYQRNPTGFIQQIEASLPGLSRTVKPFINSRGEPELRPRAGLGALGSPVSTSEAVPPDPVDQMLQGLKLPDTLNIDGDVVPGKNIFVGLAQKEIGSFKLSDQEGFMLQQLAGRAAYAELGKYLTGERLYPPTADGKRFDTLSPEDKVKAVERAIADGRLSARAQVADSIVRSSTTSDGRSRGILMRLTTITTLRNKASYLAAQQAFGYLDDNTRAKIDAKKGKDDPTVAEYVRAGPLIAQYLRLEPFQIGDPQEWKEVDAARKHQSEFNKGRAADDPTFASEFPEENALIRRYAGVAAKNPERTQMLKDYPFLQRFLTGTTFTQDNSQP